jgi:hypothetical protein
MELTLDSEVLNSLPEPDSQGLVRVGAAFKVSPDGSIRIVEVNDMPVGAQEEEGEEPESKSPSDMIKDDDLPNPEEMQANIYR